MHCVPLFTLRSRLKPILLFSASIFVRERRGAEKDESQLYKSSGIVVFPLNQILGKLTDGYCCEQQHNVGTMQDDVTYNMFLWKEEQSYLSDKTRVL